MTGRLSVYWWHQSGAAVVVAEGLLDVVSYAKLRDAVVKAATDVPRAVIVDVDRMRVRTAASLALFPAVASEIALWPGLQLLLVAAGEESHEVLATYRMRRFVQVHRSVEDAMAAIGDPPPRRVARVELPNGQVCHRLAAEFVTEWCQRWQVTDPRTTAAVRVAKELVDNTMKHTYGPPTIRLELRSAMLTVAVYDDDPAPARATDPGAGPLAGAAHGMGVVARLCRTWGSTPTPLGGKVVWAVL